MLTSGNGTNSMKKVRLSTAVCFVLLSIFVLYPLIHSENRSTAELVLRIVGGAVLLVVAFSPIRTGKGNSSTPGGT